MKRSSFLNAALACLLAAACLLPAFARAQTPVIGAPLIVASDGSVSAVLLGSDVPMTYSYALNLWWATGPGPMDVVNGGSFASQNRFTGQSSAPGSAFTSPPLPAGTPIVLGATIQTGSAAGGDLRTELLHTGMAQPMIIVQPDTVPTFAVGAIFDLPGGGVGVGFPLFSDGASGASLNSFPLRIGLSNVCMPG